VGKIVKNMETYKKLEIWQQNLNLVKKFAVLIHTFQLFLFFSISYCSIFEPYFLPYSAEEVVYMQAINVLSEGEESCGKNPAGCALENKKSVSFGYTYLNFKDNLSSIKLFLPGKFSNLGFLLRYADFGETEFVSESFDITKEKLYSIILNTSLGKEIFFTGLFLGFDLNFGNVKLDKAIQTFGCSFGTRYIFNFVSTELHFASTVGTNFAEDENLFFYAFGLKYYIPEYKSFLSLAYNKNVYEFLTTTFELDLAKNFLLIFGYETSKGLSNYSIGGKFKIKNLEFVFSTRYNTNLYFTPSLTISFYL
jgi:hypothetical protein